MQSFCMHRNEKTRPVGSGIVDHKKKSILLGRGRAKETHPQKAAHKSGCLMSKDTCCLFILSFFVFCLRFPTPYVEFKFLFLELQMALDCASDIDNFKQEGVVTIHGVELIISYTLVARLPQAIGYFLLLPNREQDVGLDSED